jgi:hypothetical protein
MISSESRPTKRLANPRRDSMPENRSHGCSEFRRLRAISRRAVLQAGAVAPLGLTMPVLWNRAAQGSDGGPGFGAAKRWVGRASSTRSI